MSLIVLRRTWSRCLGRLSSVALVPLPEAHALDPVNDEVVAAAVQDLRSPAPTLLGDILLDPLLRQQQHRTEVVRLVLSCARS